MSNLAWLTFFICKIYMTKMAHLWHTNKLPAILESNLLFQTKLTVIRS